MPEGLLVQETLTDKAPLLRDAPISVPQAAYNLAGASWYMSLSQLVYMSNAFAGMWILFQGDNNNGDDEETLKEASAIIEAFYGAIILALVAGFSGVHVAAARTDEARKHVSAEQKQQADEKVGLVLRAGWSLGGGVALFIIAFSFVIEPLLLLFGQDPAVAAISQQYYYGLMWGIPALVTMFVNREFLNSSELTRPAALNLSIVNTLVAFPLGYFLVVIQKMGAFGLGIANATAAWLTCLLGVAYMKRRADFAELNIFKRTRQHLWSMLKEVFSECWPIFSTAVIDFWSLMTTVLLVGNTNTKSLTAQGIMNQFYMISISILVGLFDATYNKIGRSIEKRPQDIKPYSRAALGLGWFISAFFLALWATFPKSLMSVFYPAESGNPEVVDLFVDLSLINGVILLVVESAVLIHKGMLIGIHEMKESASLSFTALIVFGVSLSVGLTKGLNLSPAWTNIVRGFPLCLSLLLHRRYWSANHEKKIQALSPAAESQSAVELESGTEHHYSSPTNGRSS